MGTMNLGVRLGEVYTNYGQGSLRQTDNNYNVAIEGKGFFEIRKGDEIRYTRDGSFKMDRDGYVIDADGNHVQGESGDIQVPLEASIYIDNYGGIFADGAYIDSIKLVDFEDYDYLEKIGDTSYKPVDGAVMLEGTGTILQGFVEQSNVNGVSEMVDLIAITRAYEANQKIIQGEDSLLEKTVNQIGKV